MPVHDWTRVISGIFHDFRLGWVANLATALNNDGLPDTHYSLLEHPERDAFEQPGTEAETDRVEVISQNSTGTDVEQGQPPFGEDADTVTYARRADHIVVRGAADHRVVAYIEVASPGNKHSLPEITRFKEKFWKSLERGCHLLVVDIHPPGNFNPRGLHAELWEERYGAAHGVTAEKPLGLASYRAAWSEDIFAPTAYFEPAAVGAELPDMPLFLTPERYIYVPLESTYQQAWRGVPKYWREVIEGEREHIYPDRSQ